MGSVLIKDPAAPGGVREAKLISGIDDHSRYSVIGTVVARATARAVCTAFVTAMAEYGVPDEVLSDNGRQFTGRFGAPRPAEVLFERICRHNGITQRLTKPRSPTTTGKVERWHRSIQDELLDPHGPFDSLEAAQAAVDAWRTEYNTLRPHQSLDMATPAERFAPVPVEQRAVLGLWRPPELASASTGPGCESVEDLDFLDDEPDDPGPLAADPVATPGGSIIEQPVATHSWTSMRVTMRAEQITVGMLQKTLAHRRHLQARQILRAAPARPGLVARSHHRIAHSGSERRW
jgi:Integrase core domain